MTAILDVNPPRVVSVAVERVDLSAKPKVYVPASDQGDVTSERAMAKLRRSIGDAVKDLEITQLTLAEAQSGQAGRGH